MTTAMKPKDRAGRTLGSWLGLAGALALTLAGLYLLLGGPVRAVPAPVRVTTATPAPAASLPVRAIEAVRVGDRMRAGNPEGTALEPEVDPATWRQVELVLPREGGPIDIVLLRPLAWIEATGAQPGATIELDLEEMDAAGPARVVSVGPCPPLRPGAGRVVTGTFTHVRRSVVDVRLEGQPEPIGATANHPFYSEDRRAFVAASALRAGERLRTAEAGNLTRVVSVTPRSGEHRVYNLEVNAEHVYRVSGIGVLVHNTCNPGEAGRFADLERQAVSGDNLTPHHMPQAALEYTSRADGGALILPHSEHVQTRTYGAAGRVTKQQNAGSPFRDVLAKDIRDVRDIAGSKYNRGMRDLVQYYKDNFPGPINKPSTTMP